MPRPGLFVLALLAAASAFAQTPTWDTSGNGLLQGNYYFREVIYYNVDAGGNVGGAYAIYGNITFNGAGGYSISNASVVDSNSGSTSSFSTSGTYSIGAAGYGFLSHPFSSSSSQYTIYGLVSNKVLVASATENGFNDFFVAAQVPSPAPTSASFNGSYTVAGFLPSGSPTSASDTLFQLNPNGSGSLGTISVNGYFGGGGATKYGQTLSNVKYVASNGAINMMFPQTTTGNFYSGNEYLYFSPDGNFVFGGSPNGFDIFVGVKNASSTTFSGLYYEAGIDEDATSLASTGAAIVDTFYGSFNAINGNIAGHQRLYSPVVSTSAFDYTYNATYPSSIGGGTYTNSTGDTQYFFSGDGHYRIGFGIGPALSMQVAVQGPVLTGTGVFLNPTGITNAASFSPFTAGVAPGEFLVLYGSGLANSSATATTLPFPTTLSQVQVTVNGIAAPIFYVTPGQIAIIVPFGIAGSSIASIQVTNNGAASNAVTEFVDTTAPGLFTLTANGLGSGAIEHGDLTVVTPSHPAAQGETVALFVSGLGAVFPTNPDGAAGPATTLSQATSTFNVYIGGKQATVSFAGLAPYLAGLYQMNVTVPTGLTPGDNTVAISGPDSYAYQGTIAVAAQ